MSGIPARAAIEKAFQYAMQNEKRIRNLLRKAARGDEQCALEMFSDVALERLPRLFELYDGVRPIDNYMLNNIRWYAFKYVNARRRGLAFESEETYEAKSDYVDALDNLNELDRYLIEASVFYDMSYKEIAADLQWSVSAVSRAVKKAKQRVADMYDENRDWVFVKRVLEIITS